MIAVGGAVSSLDTRKIMMSSDIGVPPMLLVCIGR